MDANLVSAEELHAAVRRQYEMHPYPDYGLFLPMQWQEAYASTALFAAQIAREKDLLPALDRETTPRILMAGCGDAFPAFLARWEPRAHRLHALDLSARSLARARVRTSLALRGCSYIQADLGQSHLFPDETFSHIDSYGVLHHLAHPLKALPTLLATLKSGGTLRLMVYNSATRSWIHELQKAFRLLGLHGLDRSDVREAQNLLRLCSRVFPALRERLAPMKESIDHPSRCVDTFLHAREACIGIADWLEALASCGMQVMGLFDRYAELDDLPNPLYRMPTLAELEVRIQDRRFENNFELYCCKGTAEGKSPLSAPALGTPWAIGRRPAPRSWGSYEETRDLSWRQRWALWKVFRRSVYRQALEAACGERRFATLKPQTLGRLARIGALWPSTLHSRSLFAMAHAPLHDTMEAPAIPASIDPDSIPMIGAQIKRILISKRRSLATSDAILLCLAAAQRL